MKSQFKRFSKSSISVLLSLCMLITCVSAGIITTDAAKIDTGAASDAAVGAAVQDDDSVGRGAGYVLYGTNDDPSSWTDTGANVNNSGTMYTASIPKSKFTSSGANYFIGLSSSTSPSNMFFQSSDITVKANGAWFSGSGSQSRDRYRFARISFGTVPTSDIQLQVDTSNNTYTFSYTASTTTYSVTVEAGAGGQVVAGGVTITSGNSTAVSVGKSAVSISATAQTGYQFSGWSSTGSVSVANTSSATTTMTATGTGTVTANFTDVTATRRIYFDNSKAGWSQPYAYAFDANDVIYSAAWPGTKMTLYKDKVWYVDVSTAATKIIFSSGSNTDQTSNLTIPWSDYTNPTYYRFKGSSPSWGEYQESSTDNNKKYVTNPINNQSASVELYTNIDATFYDYYTSGEYNNGTPNYFNGIKADTEGWVSGISERYPYTQFDKSLSEYAKKNSVAYPMYYLAGYYKKNDAEGDRYHPGEWYNEGTYNSGKGRYINDSNQLGGNNKAVTGLSGQTLQNGTIHHYSSSGANQNGAPMAMFDEDWLTSRTQGSAAANNNNYTYGGELATIINSKFPVRKTTTPAGYNRIYLDTSNQTWWANDNRKIIAHLWNNATDFVDIEMTKEANNFYSVECTGFSSVLFYRGTKFGEYNNQTYNLSIPASNITSRTYVVNSQSGNYCGGYWTDTNSTYLTRDYDSGGQTYYEFDSTGGKDNIWFEDLTQKNPTMYYGSGSGYAVKNGYNGKSSFMPFDKYNNTYVTGKTGVGKDLGMGMKLEINFTLGRNDAGVETGVVDGHQQKFNFSGDDDLWVFVDDKLILDLGGAHAVTQGSINFATKTVTTNPTPYTGVNSVSRNGSFTLDNKEVHKMTIFYTERGMHESNLKFGFSFAPVDTDVKVNKVVSPANVNPGLRTDVLNAAANDTFTVNHYYGATKAAAEAKTNNIGSGVKYTLTDKNDVQTAKTTGAGGTYPIKDGETAQFANVLHKATYLNKYFNLEETFPTIPDPNDPTKTIEANVYRYTPDFTVKDRDNGNVLPTFEEAADGSGGSFLFNNYAQSAVVGDMTPVHLDATFTNAIKTHTLVLSKNVLDNLGDKTAPYDQFRFKVEVDVDGEKNAFNYKTYALKYQGDVTGTTAATGTDAGVISLANDQYAIITGIPENARVRVTEVGMGSQYQLYDVDVSGVTKNDAHENSAHDEPDEPVVNPSKVIGTWFKMTADADVEFQNLVWTFEFIYHYPSRLTYYQNDWKKGKWSDGKSQDDDDIRLWGDEMEYTVDGILDNKVTIDGNEKSYLADDPKTDGIVKYYKPDQVAEGDNTKATILDLIGFYSPNESNFKEKLTWDTNKIIDYGKFFSPNHPEREWNADYPKYWTKEATDKPITIETSEENAEVTVHIYANIKDNGILDVDFILPFDYTETTSGMQYILNDGAVAYDDLFQTLSGKVRFQNRYSMAENWDDPLSDRRIFEEDTTKDDVFVEAPDCVMKDGVKKYFYYWKVYRRGHVASQDLMESDQNHGGDAMVLRKCYNKKFNLAVYEDYTIYPYYGQDEHIASQMAQKNDRGNTKFANISFLETTRNQWNYYGGGKVGDEHHENDAANTAKWQNYGDRLFSDFVVEYGYSDGNTYVNPIINSLPENSNIKTGIIIERVKELKNKTVGGKTVKDTAMGSYQWDPELTDEEDNRKQIELYVNSGNRSGRALINAPFSYKQLDNKNMVEQFYSFANYYQYGTKDGLDWEVATDQTTLRNYLYRAYAYIKVGSDDPVVSEPVYYTIYDEATKGHVTDAIYVNN